MKNGTSEPSSAASDTRVSCGRLRFEQGIERKQSGCRVAAPAAKSGTVRNLFLQRDAQMWLETNVAAEKACRSNDEVILVCAKPRVIARELQIAFFAQLDFQPIKEGNRTDQTFNFVKAVVPEAFHLKVRLIFAGANSIVSVRRETCQRCRRSWLVS